MSGGPMALPDGRRGQVLAVAMLIAALGLVWLAAASPLLDWYCTRAAQLAQQQELAAHMAALGQEIPALREAVAKAGLQSSGAQVLLAGNTDAIAGANLQSALQNLASEAGTSLDSSALLPVQQEGGLRRIGMQVSLTAPWPALIALLEAIETARPCMAVDGMSLNSSTQADANQAPPVQAVFTVSGFRAGGGA
jgi:general secretion pathway protein M